MANTGWTEKVIISNYNRAIARRRERERETVTRKKHTHNDVRPSERTLLEKHLFIKNSQSILIKFDCFPFFVAITGRGFGGEWVNECVDYGVHINMYNYCIRLAVTVNQYIFFVFMLKRVKWMFSFIKTDLKCMCHGEWDYFFEKYKASCLNDERSRKRDREQKNIYINNRFTVFVLCELWSLCVHVLWWQLASYFWCFFRSFSLTCCVCDTTRSDMYCVCLAIFELLSHLHYILLFFIFIHHFTP